MATNFKKRMILPGSERRPMAGFRATNSFDPNEKIEITVTLKPKATISLERKPVAAKEFRKRDLRDRASVQRECSASKECVDRVVRFAKENKLEVLATEAVKRSVVLSGTVKDFSSAFSTSLQRYENGNSWYRGRTGPLEIPEELKDDIESVLGLDDRPQAKTHFRRRKQAPSSIRAQATAASFTPVQLAQLYQFPAGQDGAGQCIALIELGGGFSNSDLKTYFQQLAIPLPVVKAVAVDGAGNAPTGSPDGPDGEVVLDIEVAGAVAPGATIVVYFAPNTDRGFLDAINGAIHDDTNKPNIISISWGGPESSWTQQAMQSFDSAFQVAAAMNITVCVASGDNGSSDGVTDGGNHVDFPASSPHVLGCGGTTVEVSAAKISSESVWNDGANGGATGGGFSTFFATPDFQAGVVTQKFRGVPDVAGDADPSSGYQIFVDGGSEVFGGTSAVAPLWAGLIARLNQATGTPLGYVNPLLYAERAGTLNDIVSGDNGAFAAGKGWDACTGLGSPDGDKLLSALKNA